MPSPLPPPNPSVPWALAVEESRELLPPRCSRPPAAHVPHIPILPPQYQYQTTHMRYVTRGGAGDGGGVCSKHEGDAMGDALVRTLASRVALEFGPPQVRITYSLRGQMLHAIFQPSLSPHHPCSLLRTLAPSSLSLRRCQRHGILCQETPSDRAGKNTVSFRS